MGLMSGMNLDCLHSIFTSIGVFRIQWGFCLDFHFGGKKKNLISTTEVVLVQPPLVTTENGICSSDIWF